MKIRIIIFFLLILGLFGVVDLWGQSSSRIVVLDQKTGTPVPYAHVCFESLIDSDKKQHCITNEDGAVENCIEGVTVVAISSVGYETLYDTLQAGEKGNIFLVPKIFNIDEIVVTAQFAPEKADKSIYNIKVINKMQIETRGANNLSDVLAGELNMRTSYDSQLGSSLSLQGLSGEHVKFLIDGVPVIGRMDGNIDLNQLNLYNADHIEIIEGPMSVVYGSNAIAGVVNIITKENKMSYIQANADAYYESVGQYNFDLGASISRKGHALSLSGGRNFFDGYSTVDTSRSKQWKPKEQYNAYLYYMFSRQNLKLKISSQYFHEQIQDKGNLLPPYYERAFDNFFYTNRWTNKVELISKLKNDKYLHLVFALSNYNRIKNIYYKDLTTLEEVLSGYDTTKFNSILARGTFSKDKKAGRLNYMAGFDINVENGSGERIAGNYQEIGDYAAFINLKVDTWKNIIVQPGLRYAYNTKYAAPLVYSINLKWASENKYIVRASYSKGFRAPSLKELYLDFVDINHNIVGNPDLKAEYSHNFNFSMNYNIEREKNLYGLELGLFYNNVDNIIELALVEGGKYTYVNVDDYITKGIDLSFVYKYYPRLNLKVGFGETGRYNVSSEQNDEVDKFSYSPNASLDVNYRLLKSNIEFSVYYKYTGKLPELRIFQDEIYEAYLSDYHTLDLSVMKRFFNNALNITVGGKNLFNNTNISAASNVSGGIHGGSGNSVPIGWGRTFFAKVSYVFNKYSK
jgi:outer membrane receptor for ferrienterochelin and colicins